MGDAVNESTPLLLTPRHDDDNVGIVDTEPSTWATGLTLLMSVLGAGMLAIPYTFQLVPPVWAVVLIALVGALMTYTAILLLKCYARTGYGSYEEFANAALSPWLSTGVQGLIALAIYGACLGSLTVLRDVTPSILPSKWVQRVGNSTIQAVVVAVLLGPLCVGQTSPKLTRLRYSSFLGFAFSIYMVFIMCFNGWNVHNTPLPVIQLEWTHVAQAMSIYNFAFVMHLNVLPLCMEVAKSPREIHSMIWIVILTASICTLFYVCFGWSAFAIYGVQVQGNVLLNLKYDFTMQVPRVAVFVTVLTSFPMLFHPLRRLFASLLPNTSSQALAIGLLVSQMILTSTKTGLAMIFSLTGGTTIVGMCYVLPCVFYLRLMPVVSRGEQGFIGSILVGTILVGLVAVTTSLV